VHAYKLSQLDSLAYSFLYTNCYTHTYTFLDALLDPKCFTHS
jgi:hypothetical protein